MLLKWESRLQRSRALTVLSACVRAQHRQHSLFPLEFELGMDENLCAQWEQLLLGTHRALLCDALFTLLKCEKTSPRKELSKIKGMRTESSAPSKQEENTQWSHPNRWSTTEEQINHPKNFTHESPLKYPNQNRKKEWKTKCRPFLLPHDENKRASALPTLAAVHVPLPRYVLNFGSETRQRSLEQRLCEVTVQWSMLHFPSKSIYIDCIATNLLSSAIHGRKSAHEIIYLMNNRTTWLPHIVGCFGIQSGGKPFFGKNISKEAD